MNLEISLVKVKTIDSKVSKLISRSRVLDIEPTAVTDNIVNFIKTNITTFTAAITDKLLISKLTDLKSITINDFNCFRYNLSLKGLDILVYAVRKDEVNPVDVTTDMIEYNVLDHNLTLADFVPMCMKIVQSTSDNSLTKLYTEINSKYGLFLDDLSTGSKNPIMTVVDQIKSDESLLGITSTMKTTYVNSILDFLNKDVRVITD